MDIIALQETKVKEGYEQTFFKSGNELIIFDETDLKTKSGADMYQRGIAFLISNRLYLHVVRQISDNVAFVDISQVSLYLLVGKRKLLASKYFKLAHASFKPGTSKLYSFKILAHGHDVDRLDKLEPLALLT